MLVLCYGSKFNYISISAKRLWQIVKTKKNIYKKMSILVAYINPIINLKINQTTYIVPNGRVRPLNAELSR